MTGGGGFATSWRARAFSGKVCAGFRRKRARPIVLIIFSDSKIAENDLASREMFDVFISYPRSARSKVEPIKARLTALGLDCYFDIERIDGGANFPDVIDRALRSSKAVLCCWTAEYFKRPWCMIECRDAIARDIMTPVAIERFDAFDPPADLRQLNWFDLVNWDGDLSHEEWRRTLLCLGRFVGRNLAAFPGNGSLDWFEFGRHPSGLVQQQATPGLVCSSLAPSAMGVNFGPSP